MIPSLLTDSVTYDLDRAIHYALLWGLEGLELRSIGGVNDRVPFVNEHALRMGLLESDLPAVAVDPGMFVGRVEDRATWLNELAQLDEVLEFCERIGCERVVASSFEDGDAVGLPSVAEVLNRAGRRMEATGIRLCVLNEVGYVASTGGSLAALLDAVGLESVRAAWDPVNAERSGERPDEGLAALGGRVEMVRCRNTARTGNGWEPRPIDHGDVDWMTQLRLLHGAGFDGPLCMEVDVEPVPTQGLRGATELIRLLRLLMREVHEGNP